MVRGLFFQNTGSLDHLKVAELPLPVPQPGEDVGVGDQLQGKPPGTLLELLRGRGIHAVICHGRHRNEHVAWQFSLYRITHLGRVFATTIIWCMFGGICKKTRQLICHLVFCFCCAFVL